MYTINEQLFINCTLENSRILLLNHIGVDLNKCWGNFCKKKNISNMTLGFYHLPTYHGICRSVKCSVTNTFTSCWGFVVRGSFTVYQQYLYSVSWQSIQKLSVLDVLEGKSRHLKSIKFIHWGSRFLYKLDPTVHPVVANTLRHLVPQSFFSLAWSGW